MSVQSVMVSHEGQEFITVFVPGHDPLVAGSETHPNFDEIVEAARAGDESVVDLFDVAATAAQKFQRLSERVTTAQGRLYLDGVEVHNALSTQVIRFLQDGVEDWLPLVNFFEKVQANPNDHSREQLYEWLDRRDFTITPDGDFVAYKGVASDGNGNYSSITHGPAVVDGQAVNGAVPNNVGSIVEMARDKVHHDPSVGCSTGLHVGAYDYAQSFSRGAVLEVHVNPRDVVSVPTDSDWAKVRTCRYRVVDVIDQPYSSPVTSLDDDWGYRDYDEVCVDCGYENDECECW